MMKMRVDFFVVMIYDKCSIQIIVNKNRRLT